MLYENVIIDFLEVYLVVFGILIKDILFKNKFKIVKGEIIIFGFLKLIKYWFLELWLIKDFILRNMFVLKNVWYIRCMNVSFIFFNFKIKVIKFSCFKVERVIIFFMFIFIIVLIFVIKDVIRLV